MLAKFDLMILLLNAKISIFECGVVGFETRSCEESVGCEFFSHFYELLRL